MPLMSPTTGLVVVVFACVYFGMGIGRWPGLMLDRTGIALIGAIILIVAFFLLNFKYLQMGLAYEILNIIGSLGIGISLPPGTSQFQAFQTTKVGGTGLGLVISQRLAERHGGSLTLLSSGAEGTAFVLRLPL